MKDYSVKLLSETDDTALVGGYGVIFGAKDLYGETFEANTDYAMDLVPRKPVFYDHTLGSVKNQLGATVKAETDETGIWFEAELQKSAEYVADVLKLIDEGVMGYSTGSVPHLVQMEGHTIKRWPVIELSLTTTPAEPRTIGVSALRNMTTLSTILEDAEQAAGEAADVSTDDPPFQDMETKNMDDEVKDTQEPTPEMPMVNTGVKVESIQEEMRALQDEVKNMRNWPGVFQPPAEERPEPSQDEADAAYLEAFRHYVRTGDTNQLNRAAKSYKVINTATDTQGGFWVPEEWVNRLITALYESAIFPAAGATVQQTRGNNARHVPTMGWGGAAVLTAELAAFNEEDPTAGEIVFNPYKYTYLTKASDESLQDSIVSVEAAMQANAAHAFTLAWNTAQTVGTGTAQPQGITQPTYPGQVTAAGAAAVTSDEIIDVFYSLEYLYRGNASWMMNDKTAAMVRKLKGTDGQYIWERSLQLGQPATILGRPVYTNNSMPEATTGNVSIVFGDFRYFEITQWLPVTMKRLEELYAENGQIGIRWYDRWDSKVMLPAAFTSLKMG
jgi:HK97 family phage major capsid protein